MGLFLLLKGTNKTPTIHQGINFNILLLINNLRTTIIGLIIQKVIRHPNLNHTNLNLSRTNLLTEINDNRIIIEIEIVLREITVIGIGIKINRDMEGSNRTTGLIETDMVRQGIETDTAKMAVGITTGIGVNFKVSYLFWCYHNLKIFDTKIIQKMIFLKNL